MQVWFSRRNGDRRPAGLTKAFFGDWFDTLVFKLIPAKVGLFEGYGHHNRNLLESRAFKH